MVIALYRFRIVHKVLEFWNSDRNLSNYICVIVFFFQGNVIHTSDTNMNENPLKSDAITPTLKSINDDYESTHEVLKIVELQCIGTK